MMKVPKPIKGFDTVAFKRDAALRIYEQIKDMTPRQELEFWRNARPVGAHRAPKRRPARIGG